MKTQFVCVQPKNSKSKDIFENLMLKFHSCKVNEKKDDKILLSSISGNYVFWIHEYNDENWELIK